jgi:hypothetical protein
MDNNRHTNGRPNPRPALDAAIAFSLLFRRHRRGLLCLHQRPRGAAAADAGRSVCPFALLSRQLIPIAARVEKGPFLEIAARGHHHENARAGTGNLEACVGGAQGEWAPRGTHHSYADAFSRRWRSSDAWIAARMSSRELRGFCGSSMGVTRPVAASKSTAP